MTTDINEIATFEETCHSRTLDCGIQAIHIESRCNRRFYLGAIFATGSRNESHYKPGISHFLEHMMFRGSEQYPSFMKLADAFEWLGGDWNAETGHEHTEYSFNGIEHSRSKAVHLFADFLKSPLLLDIDLEREVILREIEEEINEFGHSTDMDWHMANLIWPGSSIAQSIAGDPKSVAAITTDDLREYRTNHYVSSRMILCVAGGNDTEAVFSDLQSSFQDYPTSLSAKKIIRSDCQIKSPLKQVESPDPSSDYPLLSTRITDGPRAKFVRNSDSQFYIQLSFPCVGEWHPDSDSLDLICRILGDNFSSRLPMRLREELGLVYDVACDITMYSDTGSLDISVSATKDKVLNLVREICLVLQKFCEFGPSDDEMNKNIQRTRIDISLAASDPESMGFRLAWAKLRKKDDRLSQQLTRLDSLAIDKIQAVSQSIFTKENCAIVVMGPRAKNMQPKIINIISECI